LIWYLAVYPAQAQAPTATSETPPREEVYGAIVLIGSLAQNRNLSVGGEALASTRVKNGGGVGFKAGVFPAFTSYVVGIQAESFALGNRLTAPASAGSSGIQSGSGTLLTTSTMVSLLVQYPGKQFKPYAGIGMGWSTAFLVDAQLTSGATTQTGNLRDTSFAFQYMAGLRAHLTEMVFVFGEYKYFASRYQWNGSLEPSLDFRTHLVAIGVGLSF
jgi:opacity protein-like surface antigen